MTEVIVKLLNQIGGKIGLVDSFYLYGEGVYGRIDGQAYHFPSFTEILAVHGQIFGRERYQVSEKEFTEAQKRHD